MRSLTALQTLQLKKKLKLQPLILKKILKEFTKKFQAIYDLQPDVNGAEDNILNFLNSDGDKKKTLMNY